MAKWAVFAYPGDEGGVFPVADSYQIDPEFAQPIAVCETFSEAKKIYIEDRVRWREIFADAVRRARRMRKPTQPSEED